MRRREIRAKKYLVQSRSFAKMLEATIRKYQNRTIEAAQEFRHLTHLTPSPSPHRMRRGWRPVEAERVAAP